ncbi:MAG: IS3 family transposase [Sphingobacteriales bacterium]
MKTLKSIYTNVGIGQLCMLFGKTRHAYYDKSWFEDVRLEASAIVLELVAEIRREIPGIGTDKLYHMIKKPIKTHGIKMGRDALHGLLVDYGLTVKRKKRYVVTTNSRHWMKKYPNLIKELIVTESEYLWVSDITYIIIGDDFNYLSLITDVYSKQIMGHCLHPTLAAEGCLIALRMALPKRTKVGSRLIHHSDRGGQYCCDEYVKLLNGAYAEISMTQNGDPYENAVAERVNGILKGDFELGQGFKCREDALIAIDRKVKAYNELRPHSSCDYLTPIEAHRMSGVLAKRWKPKKYFKREEPAI